MQNKSFPKEYRNRLTLGLYYGVRIITLAAFAGFIFLGIWESAFYTALIFLMIMAPSVIKKRYQLFLPFELDLAIGIFVFLSVFLGQVSDFYGRFPYWDSILHFQSGFLLGVTGFVAIYVLNKQTTKKISLSPGFISFFSVCFSLALSVVWEIFEFSVDSWFGTNWQETGIPDTMGDLIVNGIGAIIVAIIGYAWMRRRLRLPFTPQRLEADKENKAGRKH